MGIVFLLSELAREGFVVQIENRDADGFSISLRKRAYGRWCAVGRAIRRDQFRKSFDVEEFLWRELKELAESLDDTIVQMRNKDSHLWREPCFQCQKPFEVHSEADHAACDEKDSLAWGRRGAV